LEKVEGKSFDTLTVEYVRMKERAGTLKLDMDSLVKHKEELTKKAKSLPSELETLERTKDKLENAVDIQASKLNELKSRTNRTEEERSRLSKEVQDLQRRKMKLSSEVDGREESLRRLNEIGLSDENLLRITNFVERTSKNEGITGDALKKKFFSVFGSFEDIRSLENQQKVKTQQMNDLTVKASVLRGEIIELTEKKGLLKSEVTTIVTSTLETIKAVGKDAASQMQHQVNAVKEQLNILLVGALKAGEAVGEMRQALREGEDLEKNLSNFIEEVRNNVGRN
jgi:chromosome segregation ATPase